MRRQASGAASDHARARLLRGAWSTPSRPVRVDRHARSRVSMRDPVPASRTGRRGNLAWWTHGLAPQSRPVAGLMLARSDLPQATLEGRDRSGRRGTPALNRGRDRARTAPSRPRSFGAPARHPATPATLAAEHLGSTWWPSSVSQPGGVDCAGSVWPPNSRWAEIRTHWTRSGREPRARRATDQPLGKPMSVIAKAIADRQSEERLQAASAGGVA